jgi:hypothetical protein
LWESSKATGRKVRDRVREAIPDVEISVPDVDFGLPDVDIEMPEVDIILPDVDLPECRSLALHVPVDETGRVFAPDSRSSDS